MMEQTAQLVAIEGHARAKFGGGHHSVVIETGEHQPASQPDDAAYGRVRQQRLTLVVTAGAHMMHGVKIAQRVNDSFHLPQGRDSGFSFHNFNLKCKVTKKAAKTANNAAKIFRPG